MKNDTCTRYYLFVSFIKKQTQNICFIVFLGFSFSSCVKDDFQFDRIQGVAWNPEIAVPLINTNMTFHDILARNHSFDVQVDQNQFCTYMYSDTLFNLRANDMVQVKDQDVKYDFKMDIGQVTSYNLTGNFSSSVVQHLTFRPAENAQLDSIFLKGGNLVMDVISSFKQNASIRISMPGLKKDGVSFSVLVPLNYKGTVPVQTNLNISLNGYIIDLTNSGSAANDLTVSYKVDINGNGNPVTGTELLTVDGHFKDMQFSSLFGYLGQQDFSTQLDTLSFNFFNSQPGMGSFTLADPKLKVTLVNSLGLPIRSSIPNLTALCGEAGAYSINSGIPNPLPVYSPSVLQIGQELTGSFQLTGSNSNLVNIISHIPQNFTYQIGMLTNPDGRQSQNFITDSSRFSMYADLELPLYGTAKDFVITDTADFKMTNMNQVQSLLLKTTFTNSFPIDLRVQVYFTDENYQVLDSLIDTDPEILQSASVDVFTGKTTNPVVKTTTVSMSPERIQKIINAKKIVTRGQAATSNQGTTNVKIYADYAIAIKVGAIAKLKFAQ